MNKILIVEDESTIRKGIKLWLIKSGFKVYEAEDGKIAKDKIKKNKYDLILLDVMLPYINGYELLTYLREELNCLVPVIMLTARSQEEDIVKGLNYGADDYITKPFSNVELEARIKANIRKQTVKITTNLFEIDEKKLLLINGDKKVKCSRKELDLLNELIKVAPNYISKKELQENIWGYLLTKETRTIDIHISKLRKKLAIIGLENIIDTKRNIGLALVQMEIKND